MNKIKILFGLLFGMLAIQTHALNCVTNVTVMAQPEFEQCGAMSSLTGTFPPGPNDHQVKDKGFVHSGLSCIADSCTNGTLFCYSMPCAAPRGGFNAVFVAWDCDPDTCFWKKGGSFSITIPKGQSTIYFRIFPGTEACTLQYCIVAAY